MKKEIMSDLKSLLNSVDRTGKGVWVQASTLGALEALLEFLRTSEIPVRPIQYRFRRKLMMLRSPASISAPFTRRTLYERQQCWRELQNTLSAFVSTSKLTRMLQSSQKKSASKSSQVCSSWSARQLDSNERPAEIIYHLFDQFKAHMAAVWEAKQKDSVGQAVFPCRLKTLACFAKRDPSTCCIVTLTIFLISSVAVLLGCDVRPARMPLQLVV